MVRVKRFTFYIIYVQVIICFVNYLSSKLDKNVSAATRAVGNVSGNRCESDCRFMGREFNPGPVPYFRGD